MLANRHADGQPDPRRHLAEAVAQLLERGLLVRVRGGVRLSAPQTGGSRP